MKKFVLTFFLTYIFVFVYGQEFDMSGNVYDENEEPLIGVSVFLKDRPGVGTTTDSEGAFVLKANKGDVIVFSFLGYDRVEFLVLEQRKDLVIKFEEAPEELEEIVVTALGGRQRKISVVGSISSIDKDELQVPATSMANIIGGRLPGVISMQDSGEPGKNISEFWIRGIGTFGANASALVLIDGLEGNLNSIDPADVESFSILKDASATAVYGVRGANGVVLVTTKRGYDGKLKLNGRVNYTISQLARMPKYVEAYDYALLANEALAVRGEEARYTDDDMEYIKYGLDRDLLPNVNWQKEILKPFSAQQTYYLSAQGGGSVAKYFLSLGASLENAAYKQDPNTKYKVGTGYNFYNFRTNLDVNMTKTTQIYFGVDGYYTQKKEPGIANTDYIWAAQSQLNPLLVPAKYSTGELPAWGVADNQYSPYVMLNHTGTSSHQTNELLATVAVNQELDFLLKGLKIRLQGAYNQTNWYNERRYVLPDLYRAAGRNMAGDLNLNIIRNKTATSFSDYQRFNRRYHFESSLTYDKVLNNDHRTSGLVYYYMSDSKDTYDTYNSGNLHPAMAAIPRRYQGISSRLTYSYLDTYLVDVNFGYTGSENFKKGKRFGFFPSIAVGWVVTNYPFINKMIPFLGFLKFRLSYGTVGNDKISNTRFPYLTFINTNASAAWDISKGGIIETNIGADNLRWEKAIKKNIGIESRLFNDKLDLVFDIFKDNRDGIFQSRAQIPDYIGLVQMPFANVGKMYSYGADGNIAFRHVLNKKMSFTLRGNFTYVRNMVKNWEQTTPKYEYQKISGYPWDVTPVRGYIAMGLFKDEQDVKSSPRQDFGGGEFPVMPGDIKYKDVNGDGIVNSDDRVVLSYPTYPRLMYGLGGEFKYNNLTLGILFKGTGNTDYYNVGYYGNGMGYIPFYGREIGNILQNVVEQKNRWTPAIYSNDPLTENPNAKFPRLSYGYNANNSQLSTFWKGNSKYLRLQELTLNYNLRSKIIEPFGLSSIDFQFVGSNLFVIDQVKLWDPEQAHRNGLVYPIPRRYTLQIYLNF